MPTTPDDLLHVMPMTPHKGLRAWSANASWLVALMLFAVISACSPAPETPFQTHTLDSVIALLADPEMQVVDVRTAQEWDAGHLERAIWIPPEQWTAAASRIPRSGPVLVLCHSGGRAQKVAHMLIKEGFSDVHVLVNAGVPDLL